MRIILHPSLCPNSVLRACALRLFAGVGPPLRALFCCPAAPGGWNPGAKTGGTLLSRPFFGGCAGGAPDLSAAMTRPCLRDAGTYDFRTKWFLIFFKKIAIPSFSAVLPPAVLPPAVLPPCCLAARCPVTLPLAALSPCRPPSCRPPSCRPPPCRRLPCRPAALPPAALPTAALSPCRPLPCSPPSCHLAARRLAALPPCRPPPCRPPPCHLAARCPADRHSPPRRPADSPERRMPFPRPPLGPGKIRLR